ncbi:MAG: aldolase/citrate lyase family protein [Proteobacteria bacterium]|nr:aldolase/citrate lyase family protein [Pseudomonadota bacterium]
MNELTNPALERLKAGEVSLGVGIRISGSSAVALTMAIAGFDWLFIDLEHGSLSVETCANLSAAALGAGIAPLVRVPQGQNWMVTRVLEGGATGVVMPDVRSVEEAREFVDHVKYPPLGRRNAGGPPVHTGFTGRSHADLATMYNKTTLAVVMLERPETIAMADDIAALDGVDVLMVGCGDLTAELGIAGRRA